MKYAARATQPAAMTDMTTRMTTIVMTSKLKNTVEAAMITAGSSGRNLKMFFIHHRKEILWTDKKNQLNNRVFNPLLKRE